MFKMFKYCLEDIVSETIHHPVGMACFLFLGTFLLITECIMFPIKKIILFFFPYPKR